MKLTRRFAQPAFELTWAYAARFHRVTCWPEVQFECKIDDVWQPVAPSEELLTAAALSLTPADWKRYLQFVPETERAFLEQFRFGRLEALRVITRCPELLEILSETPALTAFVAAHPNLRGTPGCRWAEISAVVERNGVFGLLEWLGLPANRTTLAALGNLADPEVPHRLLEPTRGALWQPASREVMLRTSAISDVQLARCCQMRAA